MFQNKYRYFYIVALAALCYLITVVCKLYYYFNIRVDSWVAFSTMLLITLSAWELSGWLQRVLIKMPFFQKHKIRFLVSFLLITGVLANISASIIVFCIGRYYYNYSLSELYNPIKLNIIFASLLSLGFHLLNTIFIYFDEYKKKWQEAEELKRITAQAQMQLMRNQIKPHFLFNNLNVLSSMLIKENSEANKFIEEFTKVYRYILKNHDKEVVQLKQELEFVHPYLFLLKKRFGEGLQVSIHIPENYFKYYVIPAALQMLIENAIKHNVASVSSPLYLEIHANGNETLVIRNNMQPRLTPEESLKIGLQNIQQRYELISSRRVEFHENNNSFEVVLPLLHINTTS